MKAETVMEWVKLESRVYNYLTEIGIERVKLESRVHNNLTEAGM